MMYYESPKVYSVKDFIAPVHLQATGAIAPDCTDTPCSETNGIYCADPGALNPNGSDYILLFELTNTNCAATPNPFNLGCQIILNDNGSPTPLNCVLSSSPVILSASCTEQGCNGEGAIYEIFCPDAGNPDCETSVDPGDTITIQCPAGNSVCDHANIP
jgi:hypothetical protein